MKEIEFVTTVRAAGARVFIVGGWVRDFLRQVPAHDKDYTVAYANNVNAGTATIRIHGIGNYLGDVEKTFTIKPADLRDCTITISKTNLVYNTKYQEPALTVKLKGKKVGRADYSVVYANNRYVGRASVTISGNGNFINNQTLYFNIVPKGTAIKKLKTGDNAFTITWKANRIQTTGYQIQYSTKKNFKGAKIVTVASNKTKSYTVRKLKSKKVYYVRIRTYCRVQNNMFYSSWSAAKKVRTK